MIVKLFHSSYTISSSVFGFIAKAQKVYRLFLVPFFRDSIFVLRAYGLQNCNRSLAFLQREM